MPPLGLGRVKTLGREELVERPSSPASMSSRAMASELGNRGAGRTRFPSVNALSEFLHGQGQMQSINDVQLRGSYTPYSCRDCCTAVDGASVPDSDPCSAAKSVHGLQHCNTLRPCLQGTESFAHKPARAA